MNFPRLLQLINGVLHFSSSSWGQVREDGFPGEAAEPTHKSTSKTHECEEHNVAIAILQPLIRIQILK